MIDYIKIYVLKCNVYFVMNFPTFKYAPSDP